MDIASIILIFSSNQICLQHTISISGNNNRPPVFSSDTYSATITKRMPPDVPLHFVDTSLDITAEDGDFVSESPNTDDTSNNVVICSVEDDPENVIKCEAKMEEANGPYRMFLSLTKPIDYMAGSSYTFKLSAKVSEPYCLLSTYCNEYHYSRMVEIHLWPQTK